MSLALYDILSVGFLVTQETHRINTLPLGRILL